MPGLCLGLLCCLPVEIGLFEDGISSKALQSNIMMIGVSEVWKVWIEGGR